MPKEALSNDKMNIEDCLEEHGSLIWSVRGRSMKPLIREKVDYVVIERPDREIEPYDVVLYHRNPRRRTPGGKGPGAADGAGLSEVAAAPEKDYVLHRVIRKEGGNYLILGDNCAGYEHVPAGDVIGVMTALFRKGKAYNFDSAAHRAYMKLWIRPHSFRAGVIGARIRTRRAAVKTLKRVIGSDGVNRIKNIVK